MSETAEIIDPQERARAALAEYRQINTYLGPGSEDFAKYDRWYQACAEVDASPDLALEITWLRLERFLAMHRAINPATGKSFKPKDITEARNGVRRAFEAIRDNSAAPFNTRVRAELAATNINFYEQELKTFGRFASKKDRLPQLRANQRLARLALTEPENLDPELADTLAVLSLLNEQGVNFDIVALPAAPRQDWTINAYNHGSIRTSRIGIAVGDTPHPDYIIVPPEAVGNEMWSDLPAEILRLDGSEEEVDPAVLPHGRFATLTGYAEYTPGLLHGAATVSTLSSETGLRHMAMTKFIGAISKGLYAHLGESKWYVTTAAAQGVRAPDPPKKEEPDATKEPLAPLPDRNLLLEAAWYLVQPGEELDDATKRSLLINIRNLEVSEGEEDGLLPLERYALGWMRMEHAKSTLASGDTDTAGEWFGKAVHSFLKAAEDFLRPPRRPGMACEALLAFEGALIYQDVLTNSDRDAVREQIAYYAKTLAALFEKIREHQVTITDNPEESAILHDCANRTTLALLLMGATDPTMRHLVLPTHIRGKQHRQRLVAFHIVGMDTDEEYDTTVPIDVLIAEGNEIQATAGRLAVGRELLAAPDDPLGFLAELAEIIRPPQEPEPEKPVKKAAKKPPQKQVRYKKGKAPKIPALQAQPTEQIEEVVRTRSEAADALATAIADGISDAYEAAAEAKLLASMSANQRKKYGKEKWGRG